MTDIARLFGWRRAPGFYKDRLFHLAVLAAFFFWAALWLYTPVRPVSPHQVLSWKYFFLVFLQPILEESAFRGFLQGWFYQFPWGRSGRRGVTSANGLTSILFTLGHFGSHPPLWAVSVLIPSLIFGYFRDRYGSVYPSIVLHLIYNAGYFTLTGLP